MTPEDLSLVHLSTWWTGLHLARGSDTAARRAHAMLVGRYLPVARRYLAAAVGDPDAADDLAQEFALKLVRGDFRNACPDTGRFRDYLRQSLAHLAADHHRRRGRSERSAAQMGVEPAVPPNDFDPFQPAYIERLLGLAWERLARLEADTGRPLAAVLRLKAGSPAATSDQLAGRLSAAGPAVSAGGVRKTLMEARARFADFLVAEVAAGVRQPMADAVVDELIVLGLFGRCRDAVGRRWPEWAARGERGAATPPPPLQVCRLRPGRTG